jgi:hypothetical protein
MSKLRELLDEMAEQRGRLVICPLLGDYEQLVLDSVTSNARRYGVRSSGDSRPTPISSSGSSATIDARSDAVARWITTSP